MLPSVTAHISVVRWRQQCLVLPSVDLAEIAWNNDNKIPSRMHAHRFSWFVIAAEYRSARRSKTLIWTSASLISNPCVLIVRVWSPQAFSSWLCLYQTSNHMRSLYDSFDTQIGTRVIWNWTRRTLHIRRGLFTAFSPPGIPSSQISKQMVAFRIYQLTMC